MSSFKSSKNIQKKEGGPDRSVSDNQSSSVTLNYQAIKAENHTVISSFGNEVIDKNPNGFQMTKMFKIYESKPEIFTDFSEYFC